MLSRTLYIIIYIIIYIYIFFFFFFFRRGGYQTRGGGGRALRDNNWRSTQPMGEGMEGQSQTPGWSGGGGGGGGGANNHWNTSSPGEECWTSV